MTSFLQRILVDSHHHEFVMTQNTQKRCCWHCNIILTCLAYFPPITLLYYNGIPEFYMRKCSILTLKYVKQCKMVEILLTESQIYRRNGKLQRLSRRYSCYMLIWRQGDVVQNLESPGLSRRVASTA